MRDDDSERVMLSGGTFIDGCTSELSADGPLREPYVVYCQGGTHWIHVVLTLDATVAAIGNTNV
jgi:cystathionine beta-lyase family protein involved in aluminum resistance